MKYLKDDQNAKDATQQVFEKCIEELHKYPVDYFKSWLYMITKNYCLMQLRNHPLKNATDIDNISYQLKDEDNQDEISKLEQKDLTLDLMLNSIKELNKEQQQTVTLFYLEKKSYQEIAELLNMNYLQVKSHIQNGKRNLKLLIEKNLKINKING